MRESTVEGQSSHINKTTRRFRQYTVTHTQSTRASIQRKCSVHLFGQGFRHENQRQPHKAGLGDELLLILPTRRDGCESCLGLRDNGAGFLDRGRCLRCIKRLQQPRIRIRSGGSFCMRFGLSDPGTRSEARGRARTRTSTCRSCALTCGSGRARTRLLSACITPE